jgi:uncharacterized protein
MSTLRALCCFLVGGWAFSVHAVNIPALRAHVTDVAGVLQPQEAQTLEQSLAAYEQRTGHQFAVLLLASLEGEPIENVSIQAVESWKLGSKKRDDGVLLLLAMQDRAVRIEVGHGLEGVITDALSSRVIRDVLAPAFKQGRYSQGVLQSMDVLMRVAEGDNTGLPPEKRTQKSIPLLVLLFIVFVILLSMFGRGGRGGPMFFGGGGFGGGFGGGGFSGGGGSFGGGGASGRW